MRSWLAKQLLTRNLARLRRGDYGPLLRLDAPDVRFRFPGDSSWAAELLGRDALERWLQRFVESGIQIFADEVVVIGPPWRMTMCVRGTDHLDAPSGERVYENRYVIWGRLAWGRLTDYEVYEDTQRAAELDRWLQARGIAQPAPLS